MSLLPILYGITLFLVATTTIADVTIAGTRIIFPSTAKSVSVQLNNIGDQPALIQAWLDDGDPKIILENPQLPLMVIPSLTRLEPKKGQQLRVIPKAVSLLPQDKESLFWFNILDIPPVAQAEVGENKLRISIRSRIKLFYRPTGLKPSLETAFKSLTFKYQPTLQAVEISNPSPYYMSLNKLIYLAVGKQKNYNTSLMIAPFSSEKLLQSELDLQQSQQISYEVINDNGSSEIFSTVIQ